MLFEGYTRLSCGHGDLSNLFGIRGSWIYAHAKNVTLCVGVACTVFVRRVLGGVGCIGMVEEWSGGSWYQGWWMDADHG